VLTDNVNLMAMNLTNQVRSIAEGTKAVAGGDLTKMIKVDMRGEILEFKETVNGMTESLSVFADEVTQVAREVGTEGRLGGQTQVTNVGGTWKVSAGLLCEIWLLILHPAIDGQCQCHGQEREQNRNIY